MTTKNKIRKSSKYFMYHTYRNNEKSLVIRTMNSGIFRTKNI